MGIKFDSGRKERSSRVSFIERDGGSKVKGRGGKGEGLCIREGDIRGQDDRFLDGVYRETDGPSGNRWGFKGCVDFMHGRPFRDLDFGREGREGNG